MEKGIELVDSKDKIIYENVIKKYSWIVKENQKCILKCPYELATDIKLNSNNKWLELIELSKKQ